MPEEATNDHDSKPDKVALGIQTLAQVFTVLVEAFGWVGTVAILSFWFVVWYATPDQKQRIIELYILGTGIGRLWPILGLSVVFVVTLLAQNRYWRKKFEVVANEIEREGKEKSKLQGKGITKQLQHAKTTATKPRKR